MLDLVSLAALAVAEPLGRVVDLVAESATVCALRADHTVWCTNAFSSRGRVGPQSWVSRVSRTFVRQLDVDPSTERLIVIGDQICAMPSGECSTGLWPTLPSPALHTVQSP